MMYGDQQRVADHSFGTCDRPEPEGIARVTCD